MDTFYGIVSFLTLTVKGTSNPEFWALSSCTENTSWTKCTSGAPIKSWINSIVPTFDKVNRSTYEAYKTIRGLPHKHSKNLNHLRVWLLEGYIWKVLRFFISHFKSKIVFNFIFSAKFDHENIGFHRLGLKFIMQTKQNLLVGSRFWDGQIFK